MFLDEAQLYLKSGDGGNGCVAFRREKYVPKGGPDGGDGGDGGSIYLVVDEGMLSLSDFKFKRHYKAQKGKHGEGDNKHGAKGKDLMIRVPPGTKVYKDGDFLADLTDANERVVVSNGGAGGRGNARFATPTKKTPSFAEKGEPGEESTLKLELELLADVGLVGMPNAGKSTFISRVTGARPKIASYPFTTLIPNLGVVRLDEEKSFVIADIPGIIKGAHKGKGLGDTFLKHIKRSAVVLYVIDAAGVDGRDPLNDLDTLISELRSYDAAFVQRKQLIAANKIDLKESYPDMFSHIKNIKIKAEEMEIPLFEISGVSGAGTSDLLYALYDNVKKSIEIKEQQKEVVVYRMEQQETVFEIEEEEQGVFRVQDKAIERLVKMTDLDNNEAVAYLQNRFIKMGLERAIAGAGAKEGDEIKIGDFSFEFKPE